jgi:transcriptional regulator with XRE-family HTH domain
LRKVRGLSQTDLGAKIGVQFQQVQKYETGMNRISCSRIQFIADVLGVPASDFFINLGTNKDDEHPQTSKGLLNLLYDKKITDVMFALDKLGARQKASFLALLFEVAKDPK